MSYSVNNSLSDDDVLKNKEEWLIYEDSKKFNFEIAKREIGEAMSGILKDGNVLDKDRFRGIGVILILLSLIFTILYFIAK
jgi:hypothetical protein